MQIKKNSREDGYQDITDAYADEPNQGRVPSFESPDPLGRTVRRGGELEGSVPAVAEDARPAVRAESVIDAGSSFDGRYEAGQDLRILGSISGEIACRGTLTIEKDATAKARIQTRDAQVRGSVEGDIVCSGRLLLTATAMVTGTIKAGSLVVEEGASVSGTVQTVSGGAVAEMLQKPIAAVPEKADKEAANPGDGGETPARANGGGTRWRREAPNFALVSSDAPAADRN
ncbi:MAG: polymer-forming cytoskeletal protein [Chloroflexi bacterium]|nr:polymer-forming cytoskeletal protein [Chloroflexota bacterium]